MQQSAPNRVLADFLTVSEAAKVLGVSPWTLRNWDNSGKLKPLRHPINGYRIYRHEDLEAILNSDQASGTLAPGFDWDSIGESEHFVQFYEHEEFLIRAVSDFIGSGIAAGDAGIIIATEPHRLAIDQALRNRGLDVQALSAQGQLIVLDAVETLEHFMVNESPDPQRFENLLGSTIARAKQGRNRVRAFGEMVAHLWKNGNRRGAVRLEELWNDLSKVHSFALFCAYPLEGFERETDGESFADICTCHTRVVPGESYCGLETDEQRLREVSLLQQKARALEAEIVHRKEVERSLHKRERELSEFLENASEGIHQVGPDGRILWANKAELNLLGYPPDEYIGHNIAEFHVDQDVIDDMLTRLRRGETLCDVSCRMRCKDGSIKHVLVQSSAYFEDGQFMHSRCFTRDVTDRHKADQRQSELLEAERAARAQAERVSRMKDEFLATLSHELRTPLNAIFGWTQIVKQTPADSSTVVEGISVIDRNVRIQAQLIEELLDMSRIVSGKIRIDAQQVELVPLLRSAVEAVRPAAEAKEISISQDLDALAGPISGDPNRLQQIVWNLLTNAVKFTPRAGRIELSLKRIDSHVQISVTDSGIGIRSEFLPYVFERFRQEDSSITRKHGGLGLGLAIVKQLVELHGGSVRATSAGPGQGATFSISLPMLAVRAPDLQRQHPGTADLPIIDCSSIKLDGVKILVVDDDPDARQLIGRLLKDCDAEVIMAGTSSQAIELLKEHHPHVLISDIGMPGRDGYELIQQIRSLPPSQDSEIAAIALTAFARSEDRTRSMLAGYQVHLSKPVEPQELVVAVASLAGRAGHW